MRFKAGGRRTLPRATCFAVLLAVGLTACVDLAPVPDGNVSLGFYQPAYPQMVLVPGYPVYYAPGVRANYFFYDGLYWLYQYDNWYASNWYNGPWGFVGPQYVPYYVLRVPVRYYRAPPPYFRGWRENEPPHWDQQWGRDWEEHHRDWKHWDHRFVPPAAPLPVYQQGYSGDHYPRDVNRQQAIRDENYHYAPRDDLTPGRRPPPGRPAGPVLQPVQPVQAPAMVPPPLDVPRPPGMPASRLPPHAQPPLNDAPPAAAPAPAQHERRERPPAPASPPATPQVQDQPSPVKQHQPRSPPVQTEPPPLQPRYPIPHPDRETRPVVPPQSAPVPASPASQPEPHEPHPKRPPAATPPPPTGTDPPAQTPHSTGDNKARVDQP